MRKLALILLMLCSCMIAGAQDISRKEADSLVGALKTSEAGAARINLLLTLAKFQIFKQGEYKPDLDSADAYLQKATLLIASHQADEWLGFATLVEAYLTKERGQRLLAKKMVERAIQVADKGKDKFHMAEAIFELSDYYDYRIAEQLPEKIKLVEQAVALFQETGNKERQGFSLKVLADLYSATGQSSKVLQCLDLSLKAYQSINYPQLQGVYGLYAGLYYERGNYSQAFSYELLALKSAISAGDTSMSLCEIHNSLAVILLQLGEKEKAIEHYNIALQIAKKYNDNFNVLLLVTNIVDCYNRMNKHAEGLRVLNDIPEKILQAMDKASYYVIPKAYLDIYYNLHNYAKAQVYANQLLAIIETQKPEKRNLDNAYLSLINYFISSGQLKKAGLYLEKKEVISREVGDPNTINQNNYLKFRLDTASGNFKSATYHILRYNRTQDALFNETKSKQIKQLEMDYETEKKEDSIKIKDKSITVLNQQNQLQRGKLERADLLRNVTLVGIALLIVIMGLLYRQYRNKQRANQIILHKNELLEHLVTEKEWLLKEVHHRVKNNLQTVVSLLELQSENLNDEALSAIHDSQNRIFAMSLIHQKLYQSDNIASINMANYLHELTVHLTGIYNVGPAINIQCQVAPLEMDVSQAIPVGLIVNEAVTNSIKYAFMDQECNPSIIISLKKNAVSDYVLTITDNGKGLPADFNIVKDGGLGFKLMNGLAEDIEGGLTIESFLGTRICVSFSGSTPLYEKDKIKTQEKTVEV